MPRHISYEQMMAAENAAFFVQSFAALNGKAPADLTRAADRLAWAEGLTPSAPPSIEAAAGTAKTADELDEVLRAHALHAAIGDGYAQARQTLLDQCQRNLIAAITTHSDEIVGTLAAHFDPTAARFTDLAAQLPADVSPEALISDGPEVVATYNEARAQAEILDTVRAQRESLMRRRRYTPEVLRFVDVSAEDLEAVSALYKDARGPLEPWLTLVRAGHTLRMRTETEVGASVEAHAATAA